MGSEKKNPIHVIERLRIRKRGTFNYKNIHGFIFDWLLKMGYGFAETKHAEKDSSSGREIESEWTGSRKVNNYVKYKIDVAIVLKDYKEVTVEQDGKKVKTGIGRIEIILNADMDKNYDKMFSERKGEFSNFLKEIYEKYVVNKKLKDAEDKLEKEANSLYDGVRDLLE